MPLNKNAFKKSFELSNGKKIEYFSIPKFEELKIGNTSKLPFSIRILLESLIRNMDNKVISEDDVRSIAQWNPKKPKEQDIPFKVTRVLMQDFTGVPAIVDLASMREYISKKGISPEVINPNIPVDLIIDHSVQVDFYNSPNAIKENQHMEIIRNKERYQFLKWGSESFKNLHIYPPSAGICHQINLEYLGKCVTTQKTEQSILAMPDTLVGTDSHTTMINSLGIVGFGVGGIEAEAAILNEPVYFQTPKVIGVEIKGELPEGSSATDFALTLTRILRERNVVNMFVEFFGPGIKNLSIPDRATLSNMCPEYGATIAIFPIDMRTIEYLKITGRVEEQITLVERYFKEQMMFDMDYKNIEYSDKITIDLSTIKPSVAGPSLPKQQILLQQTRESFENFKNNTDNSMTHHEKTRWNAESNAIYKKKQKPIISQKSAIINYPNYTIELFDGDIVISSVTSCTNTSNPELMIGAAILAKKAVQLGIKVNTKKVKTSFAPGSRVVAQYLQAAGLMEYMEKLGYGVVGFGCITCIGNSGPLITGQSETINKHGLYVASVLSGNRNYESRIHPDIRANYLMSPSLVIAFGIAGNIKIDLTKDPIAKTSNGKEIFLKDIWPTSIEIQEVISKVINSKVFLQEYTDNIYKVNPYWNNIKSTKSNLYQWGQSSYIKNPPFFDFIKEYKTKYDTTLNIPNLYVLGVFGDSISTDHISPAGIIDSKSAAGKYLLNCSIKEQNFNTYGSRRGNHEVMMRGTFANNRIKNLLLPGTEGGMTQCFLDNQIMSIYDAAMLYKSKGNGSVIFAGKEYGSGSSRDWAAKGPSLIGVKIIIANSFERIHRSNLVGMGILPLQFIGSDNYESLDIDPSKPISIHIDHFEIKGIATINYINKSAKVSKVKLRILLESVNELEYYTNGGILQTVLGRIINNTQ